MDAPSGEAAEGKPAKIRTWWHPLLANCLRWQLGGHYQLEEEVIVGRMPLRIDLMLLRKQQGDLPAEARRVLAGLVEYLNEITLLEFKSPSETLRAGDFQTFVAYALLYRAQTEPLLEPARMNLVVLAPRLTDPYREELRTLGAAPRLESPGVWALEGGTLGHRAWLLETAALVGVEHPLLTLFSPQFLAQGPRTYAQLRAGGYTELVVYLARQIQQFKQKGVEFAMQHLGTEDEMEQALRELVASLPLEERLAGLSPEERLAGLSPEQRLAGLSPEERLAGLSPEAKALLFKQMQGDDPSASAK